MISRGQISDEQAAFVEVRVDDVVEKLVGIVNEFADEVHGKGIPTTAAVGILVEQVTKVLVKATALAYGFPEYTTKDRNSPTFITLCAIATGVQAMINESVATIREGMDKLSTQDPAEQLANLLQQMTGASVSADEPEDDDLFDDEDDDDDWFDDDDDYDDDEDELEPVPDKPVEVTPPVEAAPAAETPEPAPEETPGQ